MSDDRYDVVLLTSDAFLTNRVNEIVTEFNYSLKIYENIEQFLDAKLDIRVVIAFVKDEKNPNLAAELAQAAKFVCSDCYVICGVSKGLPKEAALFAKKSGADLILLEDELFQSSKLEFALTQTLRASFIPLKATDINPGVEIPFDVYHLLPQRKKFIKFMFKGDSPDDSKIKKIAEVGEVYVHRSESVAYKKYVEDVSDKSAAGLGRRCRAQFMALYVGFSTLVFLLTDQSERASFGEGEKLLTSCRDICRDLLETMGQYANAWDIINNSTIGEFGSVERAPAVAAYAALYSLQMGFSNIDDIMLAALLSDLGLVFLNPQITKKIRDDRFSEVTAEEMVAFSKYPQNSINVVLDRKISVNEKMRNVILSVQERADGNGFPRKLVAAKIPAEAQMIQFCREFDHRTVLRLGKARLDRTRVRDQLIEEEMNTQTRFTKTFLDSLKKGFSVPS